MESLWGDISLKTENRTPLVILREQADLLTKKTQGILRGDVIKQISSSERIVLTLRIVAPELSGYSYTVVSVEHLINGAYPLTLTPAQGSYVQCHDEKQFLDALKGALSDSRVHSVIEGLITHSEAA